MGVFGYRVRMDPLRDYTLFFFNLINNNILIFAEIITLIDGIKFDFACAIQFLLERLVALHCSFMKCKVCKHCLLCSREKGNGLALPVCYFCHEDFSLHVAKKFEVILQRVYIYFYESCYYAIYKVTAFDLLFEILLG